MVSDSSGFCFWLLCAPASWRQISAIRIVKMSLLVQQYQSLRLFTAYNCAACYAAHMAPILQKLVSTLILSMIKESVYGEGDWGCS